LQEAAIGYRWIEALGGRREKPSRAVSTQLVLRNESFRNYAEYMRTESFRQALEQLLDEARQKRTALMCSESVFWRCHRRLVSDSLFAQGISVHHIMPSGDLRSHTLTSGASVANGQVSYESRASDRDERLLFPDGEAMQDEGR
jgi:uncharacterized protein (DUF488 family)